MLEIKQSFTEIAKKLKLTALKKLAQVAAIQNKQTVEVSPANLLFLLEEIENLQGKLEKAKEAVTLIYVSKNREDFNNWCAEIAHPKLFKCLEVIKENEAEQWKKSIKKISIVLLKQTTKLWSIFLPQDAVPASSWLLSWKKLHKLS